MGSRVSAVTVILSSGILTTACHKFSKNLTIIRIDHSIGIVTSLDHLPGYICYSPRLTQTITLQCS
jgi:hypothetical protein